MNISVSHVNIILTNVNHFINFNKLFFVQSVVLKKKFSTVIKGQKMNSKQDKDFEEIMNWSKSQDCPCELDWSSFMQCCGKSFDVFKEKEVCAICGKFIQNQKNFIINLFSESKNPCPNCKQDRTEL